MNDRSENLRDVWKVIIADDEQSVHEITQMVAKKIVLDGKSIQFLNAYSAQEAKQLLVEEEDIALILLDVVMEEDHSGLDLVKWIREELNNHQIRIVLRTGHPGTAPENEIIYRYEINDYKEKTELNFTKLNTTIIAALRNYRDLKKLEVLNQQMALANEEIAYASMGKTHFLTRLSHELRTPLNGLMVTAELLKTTPLSLEQMEYAEMIHESSVRMLPLLNEMLDVTRLEAGLYTVEKRWFSLKELMAELGQRYVAIAEQKKLNCFIDVSADIPDQIYGDPSLLEQVMSHLLDNSIKYTQEGFIGIEVRVTSETVSDVTLEFVLTDTGVGISSEDEKRIFEPYFSTNKSNEYKVTGLGLGLTIVKRLIELMKGNIWIDSNYSRGVQFVFTLDMQKEHL